MHSDEYMNMLQPTITKKEGSYPEKKILRILFIIIDLAPCLKDINNFYPLIIGITGIYSTVRDIFPSFVSG